MAQHNIDTARTMIEPLHPPASRATQGFAGRTAVYRRRRKALRAQFSRLK